MSSLHVVYIYRRVIRFFLNHSRATEITVVYSVSGPGKRYGFGMQYSLFAESAHVFIAATHSRAEAHPI